jgi:hypothetical protein
MRKKTLSIAVVAIICSISFVALGSTNSFVDNLITSVKTSTASIVEKVFFTQIEEKKSPDNENVPDRIIYFILFNHLVGLKQVSEKELADGKTLLDYYALYKHEGNLDDAQSQFLFQTAQDCMNAIKPIDEKARVIIDNAPAELKSPEDRQPLPIELLELQKQKDETILHYKDVLKSFLSDGKFVEFDQLIRNKIAPQVTSVSKKNLVENGEVK